MQGNHATGPASISFGGGIYIIFATLEIAATCRVTRNTAPFQRGGGIFFAGAAW